MNKIDDGIIEPSSVISSYATTVKQVSIQNNIKDVNTGSYCSKEC